MLVWRRFAPLARCWIDARSLVHRWSRRLEERFEASATGAAARFDLMDLLAADQLTGISLYSGAFRPLPGPKAKLTLSHAFTLADDVRATLARTPGSRDAGLVLAFLLTAAIFVRLAEAAQNSSGRNPRADAIAAKFAGEGELSADVLETRLDFAPRYRLVAGDMETGLPLPDFTAGAPLQRFAEMTPVPFDALGAVVLHGLPSGSRLSAGQPAGGGDWVVAPGDLAKLEIVVPPGQLSRPLGVSVEVFDRGGVSHGAMGLRLKEDGAVIVKRTERPDRPERPDPQVPAKTSDIRTGALNSARDGGKSQAAEVVPPRRERSSERKQRKAVRASTVRERSTPRPQVVKVLVQQPPNSIAPPDPTPGTVLLFKPAAQSPSSARATPTAPAAAVKPAASVVKSGGFPRSPMEEEAARR